MPKISAPTVAEHRARQREALLTAAADLLGEGGVGAVTPATVGARAGLARSSVYEYFAGTPDLLAALVEEAFPPANAAIAAAMAQADGPYARIEAYVRETLQQAGSGAHRIATALIGVALPPACQARLVQLHAEQAEPLRTAVRDLGTAEPDLVADLVGGVVQAAMRSVDAGVPIERVTRRTLDLIRHGISSA